MLDEPFGALDAFTCEELWVVLRLERKLACVLGSNDLREATYLADEAVTERSHPQRIKNPDRIFHWQDA
jgi:NitT/TauT family transport system ATP-binding protein